MLSDFQIDENEEKILYKNKILRKEIINGYIYVILKNKKIRKHRLIYEIKTFMKIPKDIVINHKDGNKLNNKFENLEAITIKENTKHWYEKINNKKDLTKNFIGKNVYCYNIYDKKELFFETISKASKFLNISDKLIASVLNKKQKTTKEYIFSYKKINNIENYIKNNINFTKINNYKKTKIKAVFDNGIEKIFEDTKEAAEFFLTSKNNINRWINNKRKNSFNIKFYKIEK